MQEILDQLVARLRKAYGERLVSVVLYGSAAAGDGQDRFSDLNVLCVLDRMTPLELADGEPIVRWWRERGNPAPLLLSEEEVRGSTDAFPIEFHDITSRHRVLWGRDVVAGLAVHDVFYRAEVEHELRAKLFRLRQKAAGILSQQDLLLRLMAESVSTFCVLFRHALILAGHQPRWQKREVIEEAAARFGLDPSPFTRLLDLRERKAKPKEFDAAECFESYLRQIGVVVAAVDRLERR